MAELNSPTEVIYTLDNLRVLRGLNSECIDLIYLDPPFNTGKQWQAPIGEGGGDVGFNDIWGWDRVTGETLQETIERQWEEERDYAGSAVREIVEAAIVAHSPQMGAYCAFMAPRLIELHRLLKVTGSIYLHCDQFANSYLRLLLDAIFGQSLMRNEITWCYTGPGNVKRWFPRKHDTLLFYAKSDHSYFDRDAVRIPYSGGSPHTGGGDFGGGMDASDIQTYGASGKVPEDWWPESDGMSPVGRKPSERTGYPTQKPLALVERTIRASSRDGEVVLDPFAGCATACIAAQKLGRRWIGIDIEPKAVELCKQRLRDELQLFDVARELTEPPELTEERQLELIPRNQRLRLELWQRLQAETQAETPACIGCGRAPGMDYMEVDHIVPRSRGGEHTWDNVQLLCGPCNRSKGNKTMAQWRRDRTSLTGSR